MPARQGTTGRRRSVRVDPEPALGERRRFQLRYMALQLSFPKLLEKIVRPAVGRAALSTEEWSMQSNESARLLLKYLKADRRCDSCAVRTVWRLGDIR